MKILLYVAKIVDWGSFKLKLRDRLPIGSHTVRKPYHPSAAQWMKSEAGTLCMRVPSRHCSADLMDSLVVPWQEIFFITDSMEVKERPFHKAASLNCAGTQGDLFRIFLPSSSMPRSEAVSRSPWRLWNWRLFGWALSCASCVEGCENDAKRVCILCKKTQPGTWHFTWCCLHSLLLPPWLAYRDGVRPHLNFLSQHQQADSASKASQGHQKMQKMNHACHVSVHIDSGQVFVDRNFHQDCDVWSVLLFLFFEIPNRLAPLLLLSMITLAVWATVVTVCSWARHSFDIFFI